MEKRAARKQRKQLEAEQSYVVRKDIIDEEGNIRCPAFSIPLLGYDSDVGADDSDSEDYGWMEDYPTYKRARKLWKKLAKLVLDKK